MGGDGGVIASQRQFMRGTRDTTAAPNSAQHSKDNQQLRARTCAYSNEPLTEPICACEMGNLYNKEAIVTALLTKALAANPAFAHIRTLKDIRTVKFTRGTATSSSSSGSGSSGASASAAVYPYVCPLTLLEFNGLTAFFFVWSADKDKGRPCAALSEKGYRELGGTLEALRGYLAEQEQEQEVPSSSSSSSTSSADGGTAAAASTKDKDNCCQRIRTPLDIVRLLPWTTEETKAQTAALQARRQFHREEKERGKAGKKVRDREGEGGDGRGQAAGEAAEEGGSGAVGGKRSAAAAVAGDAPGSTAVKRANTATKASAPGAAAAAAARRNPAVSGAAAASTQAVLGTAGESVQAASASSSVFRGLFHADGKAATSRDEKNGLFITTSGLRYSLA